MPKAVARDARRRWTVPIPPLGDRVARFETIGALRIAGLRGSFTAATRRQIPALWKRLGADYDVPSRVGAVDYGLCFDRADGFDYLAGFEVSASAELAAGMDIVTLASQRCAVFAHDGPAAMLWRSIGAIWRIWLPTSGIGLPEPGFGLPTLFERYGARFDPSTGLGDIEVWLPVRT